MTQQLMREQSQRTSTPLEFDTTVKKLRGFFLSKNFKETFPQPNLSILAACEDPKTLRSFKFNGKIWPMSQTNQMHLEDILMRNAEYLDGIFCLTASYREEPNPIPGRHLSSFCMFEAEKKGDFNDLLKTLSELMVHLELVKKEEDIPFFTYNQLCDHYKVDILEAEHETKIWKEFGDVVGITKFPERTSPFFNMKQSEIDEKTVEKLFNKCDLIVCGQETFGSAERSCDINQMRNSFYTISDGEYSKLLFDQFGEDRVINELEEFLKLKMIGRWGFGSGFQRIVRALKIKNLI